MASLPRRSGDRRARETNDVAGDGTTTATLLAQSIVRHGLRNVAAGADPFSLRRGIELAVSQVVTHLRDVQAVPVARARADSRAWRPSRPARRRSAS